MPDRERPSTPAAIACSAVPGHIRCAPDSTDAPAEMSGRRLRELSHHDKAIRAADLQRGVIGAEVGGAAEAALCETALQLLSRPTSHYELVVAGTFLTFVDEDMPLGQEEAPVLPIELSDACEREPAAISVDTLSEDRLPILPQG